MGGAVVAHLSRHAVGYVALAAALLVGSGLAYSAIPGGGNVINGCYDTATGALRVIDSEGGGACRGGETALSWNQSGPPGPPGPPGPAGPAGQAGTTPLPEGGVEAAKRRLARPVKGLTATKAKNLGALPPASGGPTKLFTDHVATHTGGGLTDPGLTLRVEVPAGKYFVLARAVPTALTTVLPGLCILASAEDGAGTELVHVIPKPVDPLLVLSSISRLKKAGAIEFRCSGTSLYDARLTAIKVASISVQ